jgi:hypothetical protein
MDSNCGFEALPRAASSGTAAEVEAHRASDLSRHCDALKSTLWVVTRLPHSLRRQVVILQLAETTTSILPPPEPRLGLIFLCPLYRSMKRLRISIHTAM